MVTLRNGCEKMAKSTQEDLKAKLVGLKARRGKLM